MNHWYIWDKYTKRIISIGWIEGSRKKNHQSKMIALVGVIAVLALTTVNGADIGGIAVSEHNRVRSGHPIPSVTWSGQIAQMAQNYANGCSARHSTSSQRQGTGENIYMYSEEMKPAEAIKAAVKSWEEEKNYYSLRSNSCSRICGHYTQIIWKTSTKIGCGVGNCPSSTWKTFVVCNYKGPGNYYGRKPY